MEKKLYAKRDPEALGEFYLQHVAAMTAEGLHEKADIAAELGQRDAEIERLTRERDKLAVFKAWVHQYLDTHGVPHHPPGTHGAEGCRIGDRMDWLMAKLATAESEVERLRKVAEERKDELSTAHAMAEGVDEHVSDMLDAMRPFADALKRGEPVKHISFNHWKTLSDTHDNVVKCLRPNPDQALASGEEKP